jgi:formylglycine-generating enzyme required for sulfatase activity
MTDCLDGDGGTKSCCTSPEVAGGTFYPLYSHTSSGATVWGDSLTVSDFRLDTYLVTVGRFRQFVEAWNGGAGYLPAAGSGKHAHLNGGLGLVNSGASGGYESGWKTAWNAAVTPTNAALRGGGMTWTPTPGSQENLPINGANWYEAYAFCIWDGGFLPSDAEWNYAAVGGSQQRAYPWGFTDPGTTTQYAVFGCSYPDAGGNCAAATVEAVGSAWRGAGRWGQLDLEGELLEWGIDWVNGPGGSCIDCAYLTGGTSRALEGCSYACPASELELEMATTGSIPTVRDELCGFRCARSP